MSKDAEESRKDKASKGADQAGPALLTRAEAAALFHMDLKRSADLVEEVEWLVEQCTALESERNKLDDQVADLMGAIGKMIGAAVTAAPGAMRALLAAAGWRRRDSGPVHSGRDKSDGRGFRRSSHRHDILIHPG
jgi:hypothetical protein